MTIGKLREDGLEYEEAAQVYEMLVQKYPHSSHLLAAVYREAVCRMWLCRRLAYNRPRCEDTRSFLRETIRKYPDIPERDELVQWLKELETWLSKDAYEKARFYDSRQRTRHAAIASWENFISQFPDSEYADEARRRIDELRQ